MDTFTVLDKYTQDLSNLPLEVKFLLDEIKTKDAQLQETRRRWQSRDAQLHKFIQQNLTLSKHPKESQMNSKIEEDQRQVLRIQKEKVLLANTALYIVSKHLFTLEEDISKLEAEDLLPPESSVIGEEYKDLGGSDSAISGLATPRNTPLATPSEVRRPLKRKMGSLRTMGGSRLKRRLNLDDDDDEDRISTGLFALTGDDFEPHSHLGPGGDDADNNLYCFCQRVLFGEMIGCDNDDCKFEWFHWSCVGITSPPKDDEVWYCPDCSPKMEKRKKKRKIQ